MARSRKTEQTHLSVPEVQLMDKTHFPALGILEAPELLKLRKQLREIRGEGGPIPTDISVSTHGAYDVETDKTRHDLLAAAVKRVNREIERRRH